MRTTGSGELLQKVTVPEGSRGPWTVKKFTVSKKEAEWTSVREIMHGRGYVPAGTYTELRHKLRGCVMSDTPEEMNDHRGIVRRATGHVLINGLGLGMVLAAVLRKPEVTKVTVVEIDHDVIQLVGPHYQSDKRVEIVHSAAFDYQPPKGVRYGAVWHDIWDSINPDDLLEMKGLKRKYSRRADWQGCWAERHRLLRMYMS